MSAADPLVFDDAAFDRRLGGDAGLRLEIIAMFLEDCPVHLSSIRAAVGSGDAAALRRAAHTLKGTAAYLCGGALAGAAAELEAFGRDGQLSAAAKALPRLEAAVSALLPLLA